MSCSSDNAIKHIVIVGGGAAGWLTAGIIAAQHNSHLDSGIKVSLIESSAIPTIGVGEGTWPTMRDTLNAIGIEESEFIACCDASFKQGSKFIGWARELTEETTNDADKSYQASIKGTHTYYHPFVAPHGFGQTDLVQHWLRQNQDTAATNLDSNSNTSNEPSFAHALGSQAHLCDYNKAPKQIQTPPYAAVANYGYHLDAGKFSALLKQHCCDKLGVSHIDDVVTGVSAGENESIEAVLTEQHGQIAGDLFIDCSGQHALLIGKHYQIPLREQSHVLFNDSAIAVQVPYPNDSHPISSQTNATAHDNGWIWDIGLPTRRGVGCVYASQYCDKTTALNALKEYIAKTAPDIDFSTLEPRHIAFTPGYREKFWHKNCVAVGMAAGFIEPLEASALALIELSAKMIAKELPSVKSIMPITAKRFNDRFEYRWQRIIEFLKLHYVLSERTSDYWQANREKSSIPARLQELLTLWEHQEPSYNDFPQVEEIFPAASYQYVLYGMGFKSSLRHWQRQFDNPLLSEKLIQENKQLIDRYLGGLPTNRELINALVQQYQRQHDKEHELNKQQAI